jgi:hypothetical protein
MEWSSAGAREDRSGQMGTASDEIVVVPWVRGQHALSRLYRRLAQFFRK